MGLERVTTEFMCSGQVFAEKCTLRDTAGGVAVGPKGTFIECDKVAYSPGDTNTHVAAGGIEALHGGRME